MNRKLIGVILAVGVLIIFLAWLFMESSKPQPGEQALQDGRNHLPEGSKIDYKFNPPTSGDHYPSWISKGFYDTPRPDGNLVHSLEHGYIIIWYDCEKKWTMDNGQWTNKKMSIVNSQFSIVAYAQTPMTQSSEGSSSARLEDMPKSFSDGSCNNFKKDLKDAIQKNGLHKLIAVPRVGMDYPLVLTAWGRMEKLSSVDQNKIKEFIDAFRDAGPEQTTEP